MKHLTLLLVLLVAACGGSGSPNEPAQPAPPPQAHCSERPSSDGVPHCLEPALTAGPEL